MEQLITIREKNENRSSSLNW